MFLLSWHAVFCIGATGWDLMKREILSHHDAVFFVIISFGYITNAISLTSHYISYFASFQTDKIETYQFNVKREMWWLSLVASNFMEFLQWLPYYPSSSVAGMIQQRGFLFINASARVIAVIVPMAIIAFFTYIQRIAVEGRKIWLTLFGGKSDDNISREPFSSAEFEFYLKDPFDDDERECNYFFYDLDSSVRAPTQFSVIISRLCYAVDFAWPRKEWRIRIYFYIHILFVLIDAWLEVWLQWQNKVITDAFFNIVEDQGQSLFIAILQSKGLEFFSRHILRNFKTYCESQVTSYLENLAELNIFMRLQEADHRFYQSKDWAIMNAQHFIRKETFSNLLNFFVEIIGSILFQVGLATSYLAVSYDGYHASLVLFAALFKIVEVNIKDQCKKRLWNASFLRRRWQKENMAIAHDFNCVKNFASEKYELGNHRRSLEINAQKYYGIGSEPGDIFTFIVLNGFDLISMAVEILTTYAFGMKVIQGQLTPGDLVMGRQMVSKVSDSFAKLSKQFEQFRSYLGRLEDFYTLQTWKFDICDAPDASPLEKISEGITFENVSFGYPTRSQVLKNLSFSVPLGKTLAIVGETGGGKSTILRLLMRYFDPTEGRILIDGKDIRQMRLHDLRSRIGMVTQDFDIITGTLAANIGYGRAHMHDGTSDELNINMTDIEQAAQIAQATKIISKLPRGFQTKFDKFRSTLSHGEMQRITVARVVMKNPDIMLLDEATSGLDSVTERNLQEALYSVCKDRTCIIVAHRLSTIMHADNIIVIHDGAIAEQGTHLELIKIPDGKYAKMWTKQTTPVDVRLTSSEVADESN
ncbi:uncharacterized protein VTP21DRAFT_5572 [Calcarisporiella thermophila]|uniref:uncharacterized protein n=1 Tax=Calcarisporiella thermophila TaxID=911321 RepID=UPI00374461F0